MPTFSEAYRFARNRDKTKGTSRRFREILSTLRKHDVQGGLTPDKAVELLEDLGATFVKLGQLASAHPDILPQEYCDAFAKLRSDANPMDFATVRSAVEEQLGRPLDEVFSEFDEHAAGSASIAQVHRAVLREEGVAVAVKVQRPHVAQTVNEDLAIMQRIVDLYDLVVPEEDRISFKELVDELARASKEELDFTVEAANLERFHENNAARADVKAPRCFSEYSTSSLLVEEYLEWPSVQSEDALARFDAGSREKIAYLLAENFVSQVMEDGFYHADPHPGNVLISSDGRIGWIDFGLMGSVSPRNREQLLSIMRSFMRADAYGLQRNLLKIVTPTRAVDHGQLIDICESLIDEFADVDLECFDMGALLTRLTDALVGGGYKIDPFVGTLARGVVTLEGTVKLISDKLSVMQVIARYLQRDFDLDAATRRLRRFAARSLESTEAAASMPTKLMDLLDMMQKGQVKVGMDLNVGERFTRDFSDAISTFAFAVLACGMVIGSSIMCTTSIPPLVFGIPVFGLVGFLFGAALMVYVTYLILKGRARRRYRR